MRCNRLRPIEPLEPRRLLSAVNTGIQPQLVATVGPDASRIVHAGGALYYSVADELWTIDVATSQKRLVRDIQPGSAASGIRNLTAVGDRVFFAFDDGVHGLEPWTSDGTEAGTQLVADVYPGTRGSDLRALTAIDGRLVFTAESPDTTYNPWVSDGTAAGTRMIAQVGEVGVPRWMHDYFAVNGTLYFFSNGSSVGELWKSDYTAQGTVRLLWVPKDTMDGYGNTHEPTVVGDRAFFRIHNYTWGLWVTDGSAEGTVKLADVGGYTKLSRARPVDLGGGRLGFFGHDAETGAEPWVSDGTAAGTMLVKDIIPGAANAAPATASQFEYTYQTAEVGGRMVFSVGSDYGQLWASDGTSAGTVRIDPVAPGAPSMGFWGMTRVGDRVMFTSSGGMGITDGTADGTILFRTGGVFPQIWTKLRVVVGDELFFYADNRVWKIRSTDVLPPVVNVAAYEFNLRPPRLKLEFSEAVADSLAPQDLVVRNLSTGQTLPTDALSISPTDVFGDRVLVNLNVPNGVLPDGNYRVTIRAGAVQDPFGNALATDSTHDFFVLAGDINRDRWLTSADFAWMATNFNRPSVFTGGDFDYSGMVDIADFALLAAKFYFNLPPPDAANTASTAPAKPFPGLPAPAATPEFGRRMIEEIGVGEGS